MECKHKQICNVCDAPFKMTRGCELEKRCPACRFLGLQKGDARTLYRGGITMAEDASQIRNRKKKEMIEQGHNEFTRYSYSADRYRRSISFVELSDDVEFMAYEDPYGQCYIEADVYDDMVDFLGNLTERQEEVMLLYFGFTDGEMGEENMSYISRKIGVTRERVRQIVATSIKKLRHPRLSRKLKKHSIDFI